ncbi:MAG: cyclic nucleotide-binding domain-containing protein [Roseibium sp.]
MADCSFKTGDNIYSAGDQSDHTFIITSGHVTITFELNGKVIAIDAGPGDFIGDSAVIFTEPDTRGGNTYKATATADTDVTAVKLPITALKEELEQASPILKNWIASFADRALKVVAKATE